MLSLKRKNEDLQRTAPGQTKLSFVQLIPKEPEVSIMVRLIEFVTYGVNNLHQDTEAVVRRCSSK